MKSEQILLIHLLIFAILGQVSAGTEKNLAVTFIREVRQRLTGTRNTKRVTDRDSIAFDTVSTIAILCTNWLLQDAKKFGVQF